MDLRRSEAPGARAQRHRGSRNQFKERSSIHSELDRATAAIDPPTVNLGRK
jgi:hypothetical protein